MAYILNSKDRINLEAVTIAPYYHGNDISIEQGLEQSYNVCENIFEFCDRNSHDMILKGSKDFLKNEYFEETEAITKMVEIINKNEITYILAIGAITNIAILLKLHGELKSKIKVIWLGGHSPMSGDNREYNFRQDVEAVKYVYSNGIDLTVIPCKNVASNLVTSIYELEHYFNTNEGIGKYLCDRFLNDGKHGNTSRRVIWDISVIAYAINPYWFYTKIISSPKIDSNLSYVFNENYNKIKFVTNINVNEIYNDMFKKIGDKKYEVDK